MVVFASDGFLPYVNMEGDDVLIIGLSLAIFAALLAVYYFDW
jgi:hypothetical protein